MNNRNYKLSLLGALGNAGSLVMKNYLKETSFKDLVDVFRTRTENDNGWRCEFWGKILRGAILLNSFVNDAEMEKIIDETIADILTTQDEKGCISSYPEEKQLEGWNLWGIKYVLIGLLNYAERGGKTEEITLACEKLLTYVESLLESKGLFFHEIGCHTGLASCSILGAVVRVWRLSGNKHWKLLAEKLIKTGCSSANNVFIEAEKGALPRNMGNGKAYELTSCFQGLAEYILTAEELGEERLSDRDYKKICLKYFTLVCNNEIMVTGASGLRDPVGEYWFDGRYKQHLSTAGGLGETCIMTTLLHYADKLLALCGQFHYPAAELSEKILYNSLLGGMTPDGRNFTHANPTPLTGGGWKKPAADQMNVCFQKPFFGHDCCRAQGPEGIAMAYPLALRVLENKEKKITGCVINLYEKMQAELMGTLLEINGDYPYGNHSSISIKSKEEFAVFLRIPYYTEKVLLNGRELAFIKGDYLKISQVWSEKDSLEIFFDLSLKEVSAPGDPTYTAVKRGALTLAEDSRKKDVPGAKVIEEWKGHFLVEYSAAGNAFSQENTLQVFFKE